MSADPPPFDHDAFVTDGTDGEFSCPICGEFEADSVRSVKGHVSGSRDDLHEDLGWNYEEEIRDTRDEEGPDGE